MVLHARQTATSSLPVWGAAILTVLSWFFIFSVLRLHGLNTFDGEQPPPRADGEEFGTGWVVNPNSHVRFPPDKRKNL